MREISGNGYGPKPRLFVPGYREKPERVFNYTDLAVRRLESRSAYVGLRAYAKEAQMRTSTRLVAAQCEFRSCTMARRKDLLEGWRRSNSRRGIMAQTPLDGNWSLDRVIKFCHIPFGILGANYEALSISDRDNREFGISRFSR